MRLTGLLSLTLLLCVASSFGQPKKLKQVKLVRSPRTLALSHAFYSGKLPEPMRLPPGNIDRQAATLAKAVAIGDDSSTAALHAAILAAGFGVRDTDKSVMQTTDNGQGLIIEASEVAALAKLYGEDYGVTLDHLSQSFTRTTPGLKDIPLTDAILDGIRKGAKSNHAAVRFWSQFIVALGKNSPTPFDLLSPGVDPAKTRLDAIQVALILKRLAGDLAVVEKRTVAHHAAPRPSSPQNPCTPKNDLEDVIADYNALSRTTLFGIIAERLGGGAANYGKAAGLTNVVLTVFKFIISYASLRVDIEMDGDMLFRTKSTKPGESRLLTATLRMDTGKWEMINCLRPVLNKAGLDVDVPASGPLAGVKVEWYMVLGGDSRGFLGTAEDLLNKLVGEESNSDAIVFLDALEGAERSPTKQRTNDQGVSQIKVVGLPQKYDLSNRKVFEVDKGAGVRVDVQLKPMRIVDTTQAISNIMDIAGNALSFLTGDALGGVVGTATETLYRSNWYSSQPFFFIVKDWEPCVDQWQGTITYRVTGKKQGSAEGVANSSYWDEDSYYEAKATISGRKTADGASLARVEVHASEFKKWGGQGKGVCYRKTDNVQTVSGGDALQTTGFSITYDPRTREYTVSAPTPVVYGSGEHTVTSRVAGTCNNPYNKPFDQTNAIERYQMSDDAPHLIGRSRITSEKPDEISGSETVEHDTNRGKKTVTLTWNLRRCQTVD